MATLKHWCDWDEFCTEGFPTRDELAAHELKHWAEVETETEEIEEA